MTIVYVVGIQRVEVKLVFSSENIVSDHGWHFGSWVTRNCNKFRHLAEVPPFAFHVLYSFSIHRVFTDQRIISR